MICAKIINWNKFILPSCLIMLSLSSCVNQKIRHDLKKFQQEKILQSLELEIIKDRNICMQSLPADKISMVMYYDSTECNECRINHLGDCLPLYEMADSSASFQVVTIFAPRQEEYDEVIRQLMVLDFPYPIYVDFDGSFRKANPCIPEDKRFHCFLLDKDGHPVFVGNPVSSERMWDLFGKALEKAGVN